MARIRPPDLWRFYVTTAGEPHQDKEGVNTANYPCFIRNESILIFYILVLNSTFVYILQSDWLSWANSFAIFKRKIIDGVFKNTARVSAGSNITAATNQTAWGAIC